MMSATECWDTLLSMGYLDEDGEQFEIGNAVMNLARDLERIKNPESKKRVIEMLNEFFKVQDYVPTTSEEEWNEISDGMWQNTNDPRLFSADGGKTYYSCNDADRVVQASTVI